MKIICIGRNYQDHINELKNKITKEPLFFLKPDTAIQPKGHPFFIPDFSNNIHYEVELVIKISKNGIIVKFLKIFTGFIHSDHLSNSLKSYSKDDKLLARVIFLCANPPIIYLSQKHVDISPYQPTR